PGKGRPGPGGGRPHPTPSGPRSAPRGDRPYRGQGGAGGEGSAPRSDWQRGRGAGGAHTKERRGADPSPGGAGGGRGPGGAPGGPRGPRADPRPSRGRG